MPDGTTLPQIARREPCAVRTLLDTAHRYDAGVCGGDGVAEPGIDPGGIRLVFDGRSVSSVEFTATDGQVVGLAAIQAVADAWMDAARMARRQAGLV